MRGVAGQGDFIYSTVQYCTVLYSTVQYCTVLYSAVQYSTVLYSAVQYCTVLYSTQEAGTHRTWTSIPAFQRFEPIIIRDFSWRFRKKAIEKHISKQMRVYKQITFFYKKLNFLKICFPDRKIDFLRGEPIFGLKNREPELDPGGPRGRVCPYVHMSILVPLDRNIDE